MPGQRMFVLPLAFTFGLAGLALLDPVRGNPKVLWAFLGTAFVLCAWNAVLFLWARATGRTLQIEVALRKQHWVQAAAQVVVLLYWGWYWSEVYAAAPFILAQLVFAYAFDMLLCWSRRDRYILGFGPFPVILSINLFLWFRPDWFYLQFAMVAVGFGAKEFIRWNKDGRHTHIFNPSSFPLAVFAFVLLVTGTSDITWGQEIASTQFFPPQMYLMLFVVALPGQYFFRVTSMTMSAVVSTYVFGFLYFSVTGVYFFYDSYIPLAVFLGMHLLFNDPSTSPQTGLGRIMYGALYGLSTLVLYQLLGSAGMPTFYDKLLQVPFLNLSIQGLDRLARSRVLRAFDPAALGPSLAPHRRQLAIMATWVIVFLGMSASDGLGDDHPGQFLPFWQQACEGGRPYACPYLADSELNLCNQGSGWACNEAGLLHIALSRSGEDLRRLDAAGAEGPLRRGCGLGFAPACQNLTTLTTLVGTYERASPPLEEYPIILRGSKGEIRERDPDALYALACRQGWPGTC
jgi:hypothetical protein